MTNIEEAKQYFLGRCSEIISMSSARDPWIFVCGAAMIDYLTNGNWAIRTTCIC